MTNPETKLRPIELPQPVAERTLSFNEAVAQRRTIRAIATTPLTLAQLSNLLWVAFGLNRKVGPFGVTGRTAASASNSQEIDVYVALEDATYLYDAATHRLNPIAVGDLRSAAINPPQMASVRSMAPVQLIYVADVHRLTHTTGFKEPGLHDPEVQKSYYFVDCGMIGGNVYLVAAAHGLAAWFHNCDRATLTKSLALRPEQKVLFAQSVGWPAAAEVKEVKIGQRSASNNRVQRTRHKVSGPWSAPLYLTGVLFLLGAVCWLWVDPTKPVSD